MFSDSLLANLAFFAIGQVAVVGYMVTGRLNRGLVLLVATWVFADVALVARFIYDHTGWVYLTALLSLQATALAEFGGIAFLRWRRSRPGVRDRRDDARQEVALLYLSDQLDEAAAILRRMLRRDPWDLGACVQLAKVERCRGLGGRAGRLRRRARQLDLDGVYVGILDEERRLADRVGSVVAVNGGRPNDEATPQRARPDADGSRRPPKAGRATTETGEAPVRPERAGPAPTVED